MFKMRALRNKRSHTSFIAHTLDSSEQNRRQRKELSFSLIFKKPLFLTGAFLMVKIKRLCFPPSMYNSPISYKLKLMWANLV